MSEIEDFAEKVKQNNQECPHCKFLYETFLKDSDTYTCERDYYLMTDTFVYLHGGDECDYFKKGNKCLTLPRGRDRYE